MKTLDAHKLLDNEKRFINSAEGIDFYFETFKEKCKQTGYEPNEFDFFYFAYCIGNNVTLKEKLCILRGFKKRAEKTFWGENYDIPIAKGRKERV